jgi:hypothetical protein
MKRRNWLKGSTVVTATAALHQPLPKQIMKRLLNPPLKAMMRLPLPPPRHMLLMDIPMLPVKRTAKWTLLDRTTTNLQGAQSILKGKNRLQNILRQKLQMQGAMETGMATNTMNPKLLSLVIPSLGWKKLVILIGFLSLFLFFFFNQLSKASLVPLKDPYLEESLHHDTGALIEGEGGGHH